MRAGRMVFFSGVRQPTWALICVAGAAMGMAQTAPVPASGASGRHMVGVRAQLERALNSKSAVEGMAVEARPEGKVHLADGVDLDRSSRLAGRVGTVKPSLAGSDSMISVIFDRVRLKDGREIPVKATILWIRPAPNLMNPSIVSAPADRTTPGVGVEAGGTSTPPAQGYAGSEITGLPEKNEDGSTKSGALPPGVVAQWGAIGKVNFFSEISGSNSGFFRTAKDNVSVPAGAVLAFALAVQPAAAAPAP